MTNAFTRANIYRQKEAERSFSPYGNRAFTVNITAIFWYSVLLCIFETGISCSFFCLILLWRCAGINAKSNAKNLSINDAIKDKEVRVVDDEGNQLGIMKTADAIRLAETKGLDLVKIAPKAVPPVCKIIDFGKYCYEQTKKEKEAKKNQNVISIKEIQLTLKIDVHDIQTKASHALRFLKNGDKVKVVVKYKGRELAHTELGFDIANRFVELLEDNAVIEKPAKIEGRNMIMVLAPNPALKAKK